MNADYLFVSGLGRCGTSLAMQMIQRAGVPCVGDWPAFEISDFLKPRPPEWFASYGGRAMKWLDPHKCAANPPGRCEVLWLDRNVRQQAKSQIKFAQAFIPPGVKLKPPRVERMIHALVRERLDALRAVTRSNCNVTRMRFEHLIDSTRGPRDMAEYLGTLGVDVLANECAGALLANECAGALLDRGPDCRPDIRIEIYLSQLADHGAGPAAVELASRC